MNPCELTASAMAVANLLAERLPEQELEELVLFIKLVQDNLEAIALQRALEEKRCGSTNADADLVIGALEGAAD